LHPATAIKPKRTVEETEHHDEHENSNTAMLTAEQMKSIKIELGSIEKKQLTASLKANGILKVPNQNRANATASLGGVIKSILVQTGNSVSKGQTIATISNNSFITMQEEFLSISSKAELAQLEFARQKELQQGNAGALKNLQSADAELKTLESPKSEFAKAVRAYWYQHRFTHKRKHPVSCKYFKPNKRHNKQCNGKHWQLCRCQQSHCRNSGQ
jgi:cobalt-zinc-cadmium efflux system membrane fusion protein